MAQQVTGLETRREERFPMTLEEFLALGEEVHAEWVDGEVTIFVPTKRYHLRLVVFVTRLLAEFVERTGAGEVGVAPFYMRLRDGRSFREPDVFFVSRAHLDRMGIDGIEGPADLVVEVISDESVTRDRVDKHREYAEAGVPEYWRFDPRPGRQCADFFRLDADGAYLAGSLDPEDRYHSLVIPGFWLRPEWLWQSPAPAVSRLVELILAESLPTGSE